MRHKGITGPKRVLLAASVASMVGQFNLPNIRLMQELGYEVHVACNFHHGNTFGKKQAADLRHQLQRLHVRCHQWDCPRNAYDLTGCCRAYRQICRLTEYGQFAWMHCHSPVGGALARLAAHRYRIPVIYTAHGFHFYQGAPFQNWLLYYPVEKFLARWTDVLITVNREDYQFAKHRFRAGKVCRIPGVGVDIRRFPKAGIQAFREKDRQFCERFQIPSDALVLLSVGELNEGKNHRMVIRALASLKRKDIYYLICGQGSLRNGLQRLADNLGVGTAVRMPGYQEDLELVYRNADIFVFPSVREGMPVSLMEAMASSLPCVVSDIRGNRELIAPESGKAGKEALFMPGGARFSLDQPCQLQDALERLLEDRQLRLSCGAYNRKKVQEYSLTAVKKRMHRIYAWMAGVAVDRKAAKAKKKRVREGHHKQHGRAVKERVREGHHKQHGR